MNSQSLKGGSKTGYFRCAIAQWHQCYLICGSFGFFRTFNLIEHAWEMLGRAVQSQDPPVTNLCQLRAALVEEWNRLPLARLQNLVQSCTRRCQAVVRSNGRQTRY